MRSLTSFVVLSALFAGSASALSHSQPRGFELRPRHMAMGRPSNAELAKRAQQSSGCDDDDDDQDEGDDQGSNTTRSSSTNSNSNNNNNSGGSGGGGGGGGSNSGLPGQLQGTLSGQGTWFTQNGNAGSCGTVHSDYDKVIAVDSAWMDQFQSILCGKTVTIKNTQTGAQVQATIADSCPTCKDSSALDLSVGAFTALGQQSQGVLQLVWWINA